MNFDPEKITFFGQTDARGQRIPFGIKAKDRQRHMYVIGKTGMGKSTMLENMAVQDIQNGEGLAFIDPHGSTAEKLLSYIPKERIDDVVYFAPFDMEYPVSFNVMEDVGPDKRHLVVSGLMSTFKKIWVDAWSARMEYILTNALLALLEYPGSTLLSVSQMLSDKGYRKKVVDNIKDPAVRSFWVDEFANYTERFAAEATPAIQNKIGQFTGNPLIRNIIGQPKSSFDIREIMDQKKILIMNLSKGLVGETNANLLGSMLTTRIYLAAMSRADLTPQQMQASPNFYFYVDEFQSFANTTFANILSEARKYKLNLTIAHQYIEQMEEEVKEAVFGNVGTTIAFRVGPFDAEVLETVFTPKFLATDLVNLGFAQIYLTLMIDGIGSQPFSAVTLPPIEEPHISYKDMVINASRKNNANNRVDVEKEVNNLLTSEQADIRLGRIERDKAKANGTYKKPEQSSDPKHAQPQRRPQTQQDRPHQQQRTTRPPQSEERQRARVPHNDAPTDTRNHRETRHRDSRPPTPDTRISKERKGERGPAKSLPDLRAVLKDMSAAEKDKQPDNTASAVKKTERNTPAQKAVPKEVPAKNDLRNLLASMVPHEKAAQKKDTEQPVSSKTKPDTHAPKQKEVMRNTDAHRAVPDKQRHEKKFPQPNDNPVVKPAEKRVNTQSENSPKKVSVSAPEANTVRQSTARQVAAIPKPSSVTPRSASAPVHEIPQTTVSEKPAAASAEVSPKELERMMRVTTSDKPPFR